MWESEQLVLHSSAAKQEVSTNSKQIKDFTELTMETPVSFLTDIFDS